MQIAVVDEAPVGQLDYPAGIATLGAVTCTNLKADTCLAVGSLSTGDAATLKIVSGAPKTTTDLIGTGAGALFGISCRTTKSCIGVGQTGTAAAGGPPFVISIDPS